MKKCIFHVPLLLDERMKSSSHIRPKKMLTALRKIGYNVEIIMGNASQRTKQIRHIKEKIRNGEKFDFLYSESSTMPTLLTEKNHLPMHPFLDFGFMKFCKKRNIPIALFYRDIYWRFPMYNKNVTLWKRILAKSFYIYDLYEYKKYIDILYLPTKKMGKYIPIKGLKRRIKELPPGCDIRITTNKEENEKNYNYINLFYVGGIKEPYEFLKLLKVVEELDFVKMVLICRENELYPEIERYKNLPNSNIRILHGSGDFLEKYYSNADICSVLYGNSVYMEFALQVKLFEYLGHNIPVIATNGTATGKFVKKNDIGWVLDYKEEEIKRFFYELRDNPNLIISKKMKCMKCVNQHTWEERAKQIERDLGEIK